MSAAFKDYYVTLGVPRSASTADLKRAFRKLARLHHPDVAKDKKTAEIKFKEINEANEVLSDPEKRRKYDALGADWEHPNRPSTHSQEFNFGGTGFSDFFEQYFSSSRHSRHENTQRKGGDIEADILVTLEEILQGAVRPITLKSTDPRTGKTNTQNFQVRIPLGVTDGKRIRVPSQGQPGLGGAPAGDLYLRVRYAAHPDFHAEGHDLHHDLEITPWEAVLGADLTVPTLEGPLKLRIPPGSENQQSLRLRQRGLPTGKSTERGDYYATLLIRYPESITEDERILWEKLRALSSFNPRADAR